jgi:hypothetical protein
VGQLLVDEKFSRLLMAATADQQKINPADLNASSAMGANPLHGRGVRVCSAKGGRFGLNTKVTLS